MKKIKIVACYHKPDEILRSKMVAPIHVGREVASKQNCKALKELQGDNTGENISALNPWYAELTALYWAWKNPQRLDNPDYLGLMHYRRFFQFSKKRYDGNKKSDFYKIFRYEYVTKAAKTQKAILESDIVCPYPYSLKQGSIAENYNQDHIGPDFTKAIEIAMELYPQYSSTIEKFPASNEAYLCNMMIMKREIFQRYCEFMFGILESLRASRNLDEYEGYQTRMLGFMGERLTSLFIAIQKQNHPEIVIRHCGLIYRDKEPDAMSPDELSPKLLLRHPELIFKKKFWSAIKQKISPPPTEASSSLTPKQ